MTTPSYNPNTPLANNTIDDGQPAFFQNFSSLFTAFNKNHTSLNDPTNPGNHEVIQLVEQQVGDTTFSQEISIYSKKVDGQTDQLFMRYPNNGKEIQLTQYQIFPVPTTSTQEAYFTFLPGGLVIYFGKVICEGKTTANISLNPVICTNIASINLGGIGSAQVQPNVSLEAPQGAFSTIIMTSGLPMVNQYYLILGNV